MEQSTLAEILGVEQDIRAQLEAAREQAGHWLEGQRREIERAHDANLTQLRAEAARGRETALQAARERAAAVVAAAEAAAATSAGIDDDRLRAVVRRHLSALLPEDLR